MATERAHEDLAREAEANLGDGWQGRFTRYLEKAVLVELDALLREHGPSAVSKGIAGAWSTDVAILRVLAQVVPAVGGSKGLQEVIEAQELAAAQVLSRLVQ